MCYSTCTPYVVFGYLTGKRQLAVLVLQCGDLYLKRNLADVKMTKLLCKGRTSFVELGSEVGRLVPGLDTVWMLALCGGDLSAKQTATSGSHGEEH